MALEQLNMTEGQFFQTFMHHYFPSTSQSFSTLIFLSHILEVFAWNVTKAGKQCKAPCVQIFELKSIETIYILECFIRTLLQPCVSSESALMSFVAWSSLLSSSYIWPWE